MKKCRQRKRCIRRGSLGRSCHKTVQWMTAMLSDLTNTPHFFHCCPQMTSSLAAMLTAGLGFGYFTWNHWPVSVTAPQLHVPEASEVMMCEGASGGIIDRPFLLGKKDAHQSRSDLKSLFLRCFAIFMVSIICRKNVRPGDTTITAWLR